MRLLPRIAVPAFCLLLAPGPVRAAGDCSLLDHRMETLGRRETVDLCAAWADRVVLVVNTASQCAFTPQFAALERLHERFAPQGLVVAGFPSGDFGGQEYADAERTERVCRVNYGVSFAMFSRIHAREGVAHPLFRGLAEAAGAYPRWNFHKYLVGRDGRLLGSFPSAVDPESPELVRAVEAALAARPAVTAGG
ncbi:MAG: glutathione peroxidase [Pseudomonadales bacterium]|jgi:glutathione peroxidase|nr:glutathione peroxidase [Pseudomonadales bacterium]